MTIYGYTRISTRNQNIERQIRNIKKHEPQSVIVQEVFTGTKIHERKKFNNLISKVKTGDTIIFDSVSRFSRDSAEGFELYEELYKRGVNLVFLKERHIDTDTYKKARDTQIPKTGTKVDIILDALDSFLLELAREQIQLAFEQSEKEVQDLRQRTREGLQTAKLNGKQVGRVKGKTFETKKSLKAKEHIKKLSKHFGGTCSNKTTWELVGISENTFYKYIKEIKNEQEVH